MKRIFLLIAAVSLGMAAATAQNAQPETPPAVADSIAEALPVSDSVKMVEMEKALQDAQLDAANLKMEMEAMRLETFRQDSVKRVQQRRRIDSLRAHTTGYPVLVEDDTLFVFYAKRGGLSPEIRAKNTGAVILDLGKRFTVKPDSIYVESTDITTDVMYGTEVIVSFTDQDGLWENSTRDELASDRRSVIVKEIRELQSKYGLIQYVKRVAFMLLVIALQGALIWFTNWCYRKLVVRINRMKGTKLKSVSVSGYELLDTKKQVRLLVILSNILRFVLIIVQLLISIPILFSLFPETQDFAHRILSYIWTPIKNIMVSVVNYVPDLFTIIIIWLAIRYVVKGIGYVAKEIESERLKIRGFYPDWAQPTFQIVRFLLYVFMIAMIYPHLPGADGGVFQGISVFVGLVISLGSTSVISNVMAGLIMTYMRPFKIGDRIKLNDILGDVVEKTPFVTRIKTIKNEIVTVPNSFILTSHTINYTASAKDYGLIIHAELSVGFGVTPEKVKEILIEAALSTGGVEADPAPFVHELSFEDFYPIYQINAYIKEAEKTAQIKSDLLTNIQNIAAREGVELLSPHYYAYSDGDKPDDRRKGLGAVRPSGENKNP